MKKFLLSLLVIVVLFTVCGCGSKKKESTKNEETREEKLKNNLNTYCDKAEQAAYDMYKQNHTNKIIDGVCTRYDQSEFIVLFTAGEKLIYKYKYSVADDKITSPDNDNYHTEKMDEYAKKCEAYDADGATQGTCAMHKYLVIDYDNYVKGVTEKPNVYRKADLSKLK